MANDELDALDALEKEAKEYDKVGIDVTNSSASSAYSYNRMLRLTAS
jgi:hypothetical protein